MKALYLEETYAKGWKQEILWDSNNWVGRGQC